MRFRTKNNPCQQLRLRLVEAIGNRFGLRAEWVQNHIAQCPRCQARLTGYGRLELALELLKSQTHNVSLLRRANNQALGVLKHSLREAPKAEMLRHVQPELTWYQNLAKYSHSVGNAAACLAVLLMMRTGIFSTMDKVQNEGQKAIENYYKHHLGEDSSIVDELFKS